MKEDRKAMYERKIANSIADVMEFIKFSEMGGEIDDTDIHYSLYSGLRNLLFQTKGDDQILDEDTQTLLPAYKEPDTDMEFSLWDCIDHGDNKKEDLI
jgi:hypothetical protein